MFSFVTVDVDRDVSTDVHTACLYYEMEKTDYASPYGARWSSRNRQLRSRLGPLHTNPVARLTRLTGWI